MESEFVWREEFNIGVDIIDKEHQRLFKIINKLFEFQKEEKEGRWLCQEGIKYFKTHSIKHFADEEKYMASIGYKGLKYHKHVHDNFRENTLPTLEKELEQTNYAQEAVDHFLGVCAGWLIGHTMTDDLSITGKASQRWEGLLQGDELETMQKIICQLVFDMFHLESHLVSNSYSGEKFGRGIYYRLVYGKEKEENKQEIFLVFEENLLINTVGKVMGIKTNKLDDMLLHAVRYTSRQFVKRVMEHFPEMADYEVREENLLFYKEFRKLFAKDTLRAGLLFDTGAGYFAYCVFAPHPLQSTEGVTIRVDNAMSEVEAYLERRNNQEQVARKRQILLVDDSETIRLGMQKLLEESYEINQAESGVAAIRAITLNRPDLILLDYEMPICDGKQTLEMIRSVKDFENIPVIFLTGRRDPASMIKVMPLKPSSYLLKSLKPAEIKQKIDEFFEKNKV